MRTTFSLSAIFRRIVPLGVTWPLPVAPNPEKEIVPSETCIGMVRVTQFASSAMMLTDQMPSKSFADAQAVEEAAKARPTAIIVGHRRGNGSFIVHPKTS